MTTETTQPQPEMGPAPDNGQASQAPTPGHRRRRRRRKNRSSQQNAQQGPAASDAAATTGPQPPQPQAPQPPPHRQNQQHQNQPRKKKKFFQKSAGPPPQPGNSISNSQHGKRKGKQRGPREFVGPMDHSYRIANGNVADGPPSTIQMNTNGGGGYYPEVHCAAAGSGSPRCSNPHLLFHRRPFLPGEDFRNRAQARHQGRIRQGRQGVHRKTSRAA